MDLKEIVGSLLEQYYVCYPDTEKIVVNINFTDDLGKTYCELRQDIKEKIITKGIDYLQKFNGLMVAPYSVKDNINILLNTNKVIEYCNDGSMTWIGTLAHELTHAIDFYQIAKKDNLLSYDTIEDNSEYLMFQFWTEYHARKLGYSFLRNCLKVDNDEISSKEERVNYILDTEWPTHKQRHFVEYHQDTNGINQIYVTMQLLGRYSVWCDLFPKAFNENTFNKNFKTELWMQHLFSFMRKRETLDSIYNNFECMKKILQENWPIS